jgi:hypothetical protein
VDGVGTQAQFNTPLTGLTISKSGSVLFVSDFSNSAIRRVDILNHTYVSSPFKGIQYPLGIAIDGTETYLYAISQNRVIYRLSLNVASPITVTDSMIIAGSKSGTAGLLNENPLSIEFNHVILAFSDGYMANAKFYNPRYLAMDDSHQNLFISDTMAILKLGKSTIVSARIRKLSLTNKTVSTVLGGRGKYNLQYDAFLTFVKSLYLFTRLHQRWPCFQQYFCCRLSIFYCLRLRKLVFVYWHQLECDSSYQLFLFRCVTSLSEQCVIINLTHRLRLQHRKLCCADFLSKKYAFAPTKQYQPLANNVTIISTN